MTILFANSSDLALYTVLKEIKSVYASLFSYEDVWIYLLLLKNMCFWMFQEDGSFFVLTNMIITPNQTQSKCAEVSHYGVFLSLNKK